MKSKTWHFAAIALTTLLAIPISLAAQDNSAAPPRYILKDLGTLTRGFNSYFFAGPPSFHLLNNLGMAVDAAGSDIGDPYGHCFTDCPVNPAAGRHNDQSLHPRARPGTKP